MPAAAPSAAARGAASGGRRADAWNPLDGKRALLIDPHDASRQILRDIVGSLGCQQFQQARSYADAIRLLEARGAGGEADGGFDAVFCEHDLAGPRSGQQLLEELRHRALLSLRTLFFIVTGERTYRSVVSTAEFAPDAYLLKPFSSSRLRERMAEVLARKRALGEVYALIDAGQMQRAAEAASALASGAARYRVDALRLAVELLTGLGDGRRAEALLRDLPDTRSLPWGVLALARLRQQAGRLDEAETMLQQLIEANPELLQARDALAEIQARLGRQDQAFATLQNAAKLSASVARLRKVGGLATELGNHHEAAAAFTQVLARTRDSALVSGRDFADAARSLLTLGREAEATAVVADQRKMMRGHPDAEFAATLIALHQAAAQQQEEARQSSALRLLDIAQSEAGRQVSAALMVHAVKQCFDADCAEPGAQLATTLSQRPDLPPEVAEEIRRLLDAQRARPQQLRYLDLPQIRQALADLDAAGYRNELGDRIAASIRVQRQRAGDDAQLAAALGQAEEQLVQLRIKYGIAESATA